jgi:hypothetical protein
LIPDFGKTPQSYEEAEGLFDKVVETMKAVTEKVMESWGIETLSDKPPATTASNESCVVQLGLMDARKQLLTADVGPQGLTEAADYAESLGLLQSPNFVKYRTTAAAGMSTPTVLNRWLGEPLAEEATQEGVHSCLLAGMLTSILGNESRMLSSAVDTCSCDARLVQEPLLWPTWQARLGASLLSPSRRCRRLMFSFNRRLHHSSSALSRHVAAAPAFALVGISVSWQSLTLTHLIATSAIGVLLFVLSDLARRRGRKVELDVYAGMGGARVSQCLDIRILPSIR